MAYPVITIGREYGSGGRIIGEKVAEVLQVPFYDKKLIELAARETGFTESFIREMEQKRTGSLIYSIYLNSQSLSLSDQVFVTESELIRKAAQEPCVIVGRCADYLLSDIHSLHVFVHAPLEERMERAKQEYGIELEGKELESYVIKADKSRANYYNYFTTLKWGRSQNYDITLNSHMGIDVAVDIIVGLAKRMDVPEEPGNAESR